MNCPECQQSCSTRLTKLRDGARERTYVCVCGWSFDTREQVFRTRSPEQRARYFAGDYATRQMAKKAKALQRLKVHKAYA